jgi:WD repeat-containing protein 42A
MNLFYHLNDRTYGEKTSLESRRCGESYVDNADGSLRKYDSNFESLIYPNKSLVGRLALTHKLKKHTGCVNTVSWSSCGRYIVTGSDDTHVCIWDWEQNGALKSSFGTGHTSNIFCAKFMPFTNNSRIITCARDGVINVFDLEQSASSLFDMQLKERFRQYKCHKESVKKLLIFDDSPHTFLSCSNDGTVRLFDLRESSTTGKTLVSHKKLQFNSVDKSGHYFCVGASDPIVRVYDMRLLVDTSPTDSESQLPFASYCPQPLIGLIGDKISIFAKGHVTGVAFGSSEILASYSGDSVYLFDINTTKQYVKETVNKKAENDNDADRLEEHVESPRLQSLENLAGERDIYGENEEIEKEDKEVNEDKEKDILEEMEVERDASYVCKYTGHCNMRTVKSVSFFGPNQNYVMSGSDDGNIFIWEKKSGDLVNLIKGDRDVVNVLSGHPFDPILATVGIDNSVKIFSPISPQMNSLENAPTVMQDNLERLEAGPSRRMTIPLALLRRIFQSVQNGSVFEDSSNEEGDEIEDEIERILDAAHSGDIEASTDEDGDGGEGREGDRPDGCPMQ